MKALIVDLASDFCSAALVVDARTRALTNLKWDNAFTAVDVPEESGKLVSFISCKLKELSNNDRSVSGVEALALIVPDNVVGRADVVRAIMDDKEINKFADFKSPNSVQLLKRRDCKAAYLDTRFNEKNDVVYLFDVNGMAISLEKYAKSEGGDRFLCVDTPLFSAESKDPFYKLLTSQFKGVKQAEKKCKSSEKLKDFINQICDYEVQIKDTDRGVFSSSRISKETKKYLGQRKMNLCYGGAEFRISEWDIVAAFEKTFYIRHHRCWELLSDDQWELSRCIKVEKNVVCASVGPLAGSYILRHNLEKCLALSQMINRLEDVNSNTKNVILHGAAEIMHKIFLCTVEPINGEPIPLIAPFDRGNENYEDGAFYADLPIYLADSYTFDELQALTFTVDGSKFKISLNSLDLYESRRIGQYAISQTADRTIQLKKAYAGEMNLRIVAGEQKSVYLLFGPNEDEKISLIEAK